MIIRCLDAWVTFLMSCLMILNHLRTGKVSLEYVSTGH